MIDQLAELPLDEIAEVCRRYRVRELALFGSALRDDFGEASDYDLLVEFELGARVSFMTLGEMEQDLEALLGRKVDLIPKGGLKPLIRDEVLNSARSLCSRGVPLGAAVSEAASYRGRGRRRRSRVTPVGPVAQRATRN